MRTPVVDSIRQAADIVQVIGEVVPLKKSGSNYFGVCPFHSEKTGSFSVHPAKQFFHCFGCQVGGDVIRFVQLYYRLDFQQSLEELGKRFGIKVESVKQDPNWEEGLAILQLAGDSYEAELSGKSGETFRRYLMGRHIPEKLWKDFHLGAHPGGAQFFVKLIQKNKFSKELAAQLGLIGKTQSGDFVDRFQGRLMFPIADEKGQVRGFGGRGLGSEQPKYINSPKSTHFDKSRLFYGMANACQAIAKREFAVLVEGYLDVMSMHEFGMTNSIGSMGTSLTLDQIRVLKRWSHRVISLFDGDNAGLLATQKNIRNFLREGIESKVVILPTAKDPDAFLHDTKVSFDERKINLKKAFDASIPALDFLIAQTVLVEKNAMARGQKLKELVDVLDQVPEEIQKTVLKKDLAKRFEIPENLLIKEKIPVMERASPRMEPSHSPISDSKWEREILKFLVQYADQMAELPWSEVSPYLNTQTLYGSILHKVAEQGLKPAEMALLGWLEAVENEAQAVVREWALELRPETNSSEVSALWGDLVRGLKRSYFQRESERLQKALLEAETSGDLERTRQLLSEKQDLVRMLSLTSPAL